MKIADDKGEIKFQSKTPQALLSTNLEVTDSLQATTHILRHNQETHYRSPGKEQLAIDHIKND